jgi:Spy/CpxP family protein refolding chaperone
LQNLHNKDLIGQNLEGMGLTGRFLTASALADVAAPTSSGGTIMERNGGWAQGQMSQGWAVEILSFARKQKWGPNFPLRF